LTHVYLCHSEGNLQPKILGRSCKITSLADWLARI
jgi:hypothetical protein